MFLAGARQEGHEEVGCRGSELPGGEPAFDLESGIVGVSLELVELVSAASAEADGHAPASYTHP
ncbi:hypothetical protein, partial [Leclercia adecarboxylata]|uniref:hypothetical protein n=1 Tax=Leclercia adecarboxylata TaxID=83655 RepID=UPI00234C107B